MVGQLQLDHRVVEQPVLELLAEHVAGAFAGVLAGDCSDYPVLGGLMRLGLDVLAHPVAGLDDGGIDEIADDLLDVAADVPHFGEFGGLDLDEGRLGQLGEAAGDLGLADAGGADHQDVLGIDFVAQVIGQLLAPPAVAQRHGHGAFGIGLTDDEPVEFRDDFAGSEVCHVVGSSRIQASTS